MPQSTILTVSRPWWEAYLLALALFSGVGTIVKPRSLLPYMERTLPPWIFGAWTWSLTIGALVALAGILVWKPSVMSALVERVGLILLGSASAAYPLVLMLLFYDRPAAWQRIVPIGLFAVLVWWRVRKISWALHLLGAPSIGSLLGLTRASDDGGDGDGDGGETP